MGEAQIARRRSEGVAEQLTRPKGPAGAIFTSIGLAAAVAAAVYICTQPWPESLHWLFWNANQWGLAASAATVIGVILALAGGAIAFVSYRTTNRAAEDAHMHALFSDYLRIRFDHFMHKETARASPSGPSRGPRAAKDLDNEVGSIKLYVLEEMWVWIDRQERDPLRFLHWSPASRKSLRESLDAWKETIFSHIDDDQREVLASLHCFTPCYSVGFLRLLAEHWPKRGGFRDMVRNQEEASKRMAHRAMGYRMRDLTEERDPMPDGERREEMAKKLEQELLG